MRPTALARPSAAVARMGGGGTGRTSSRVGVVAGGGPLGLIPLDEPVVLRRFPDDPADGTTEEKGKKTMTMTASEFIATSPTATSRSPAADGARKRSDSDALTLLRLASPGQGGAPVAAPATAEAAADEAAKRPDEDDPRRAFLADLSAGLALREHVLLPLLRDDDKLRDENEGDAALLLGKYGRGESVLLRRRLAAASSAAAEAGSGEGDVIESRIVRLGPDDASILKSWYEGDGKSDRDSMRGERVLPHASSEWSDRWMRRCSVPEAGCEAVKLLVGDGKDEEILGVARYERNVLDHIPVDDGSGDGDGDNGEERQVKRKLVRSTLLRGLRINPRYNPEVARRSSLHRKPPSDAPDGNSKETTQYERIDRALFLHALFRSVTFGSSSLGASPYKDDPVEDLHEAFLGPAVVIREDDGRRYCRLAGDQRWEVLRDGLRNQLELRRKMEGVGKGGDLAPATTTEEAKIGSKKAGEAGFSPPPEGVTLEKTVPNPPGEDHKASKGNLAGGGESAGTSLVPPSKKPRVESPVSEVEL